MVPSHVSLFTLLFKINVYSLLYCLTLTSFSSSSLWFSILWMLYFTEYAMTWHMYILHTCVCVFALEFIYISVLYMYLSSTIEGCDSTSFYYFTLLMEQIACHCNHTWNTEYRVRPDQKGAVFWIKTSLFSGILPFPYIPFFVSQTVELRKIWSCLLNIHCNTLWNKLWRCVWKVRI